MKKICSTIVDCTHILMLTFLSVEAYKAGNIKTSLFLVFMIILFNIGLFYRIEKMKDE